MDSFPWSLFSLLTPGDRKLLATAAGLLVLIALGCQRNTPDARPAGADENTVREVVATEEWIIEQGPKLKPLAFSLPSGKWSEPEVTQLFAERVGVRDLAVPLQQTNVRSVHGLSVVQADWELAAQTVDRTREHLELWSGLSSVVDSVENAKFFITDGDFLEGDPDRFRSRVGFEALVRDTNGTWRALQAEQTLTWNRHAGNWRIVEWQQDGFRSVESPNLLFASVLSQAIPARGELARAVESRHHEILVQSYFGGAPARTPKGYTDTRFFPDSVNVHPALSVVDVDQDGWDDLYVCVRWGRNMLFRNRGDGTLEEVAAQYGLDVEGRSTSATFADFDNDGDPDLMLGRSLERSQYLINNGERFVESSASKVSGRLPFLVTSTSAADFNGDGLLDVYFCTYSPLDINSRITGRQDTQPEWAQQFLPASEAAEVIRRLADYHGFLGQIGPPNLLLVNRGEGRFEPAAESAAMSGYRNSFQATWSDLDNDGDSDLYVANDFAPDHLYRNDGASGFTHITAESGTGLMGFGMGAAWGDYDNDGWQDLYISNMYSKAGRRITARVPGLDRRMIAGAEGNYLFRNLGSQQFAKVSGLQESDLPVANAGWSWGGQFADFDNDGFLDIYVSSGFYTPPKGVGENVDL